MKRILYILLAVLLFTNFGFSQDREVIRKIDSLNNLPYSERTVTSSSNLKNYINNLEQAEKTGYQKGIADSYANIAMIYFYQGGKTDLSLNFLFKAINKYEEIGLLEPAAHLYALYGYGLRRRDMQKAEKFMIKGIRMAEKEKNSPSLMIMYDNYGILKHDQKEHDSASLYFNKSLNMKLKANDSVGIPYSLNKIGMLNVDLKNYEIAKQNLDKAYRLRLKLNDKIGIAENLNFYGILYDSIGNHTKAIEYYEKALQASKEAGYNQLVQRNYRSLSDILERNHDYRNALMYFKRHTLYKDSLNDLMVLSNRDQLEVEFETAKKEKEILIQRAELAESRLKIERKNLQVSGVVFLLLISIIIGYQFYNTQKQKNIRLEKENQLKDALILIETQNQLQNQRLKISRDLHDNIGSQLTFIISSIDNLRYFLKNENPKVDHKLSEVNLFTKNTIVELRDTIWAMNKDDISFEDLKIRISNFIDKAETLVSDIEFLFYIDENLDEIKLNSLEGINLYRVIQEAINNAVKHSEASRVEVHIKQSKEKGYNFDIEVSDNGKGFSVSEAESGNGILNMKKRIKEVRGQITFDSVQGKGSTIRILI